VVTNDGHEFWFMCTVNYDKGLKNMQEAAAVVRGQQNSPAAQASGVKLQNHIEYPPTSQGGSTNGPYKAAPHQGESCNRNQYTWK
jgi:hypothetical protein